MINLKDLILVETIINLDEGRKSDFIQAYNKILSQTKLDYIIDNDPSGNYKYLDWIGRTLTAHPTMDVVELMELVKQFHKKLKDKDIYSFKSPEELKKSIESVPKSHKEAVVKNTELVYEDDKWLIVAPKSHESCHYYGGKTRWCIAASENYWESYYNENSIVIVKDNDADENSYYKVAVVGTGDDYRHWDFYDEQDHTITGQNKIDYYSNLPDEARETIENYISSDDADERRQEAEEKKIEEWWEDNGIREIFKELAKCLRKEEGIDADGDELKTEFINKLGEAEVNSMFCGIYHNAIGYHGFENAGYIRDIKQFKEFAEDDKFDSTLETIINRHRGIDDALNILEKSLPTNIYNFLYYQENIDDTLADAMGKYTKLINDPNQLTLKGIPATKQIPDVRNVGDIVKILKKTGYIRESEMIENNMIVRESKYKKFIKSIL